MKKSIVRLQPLSIRKHNFAAFIAETIDAIERNQPEVLHFDEAFEALKLSAAKWKEVAVYSTKLPEAKAIKVKFVAINDLLKAINHQQTANRLVHTGISNDDLNTMDTILDCIQSNPSNSYEAIVDRCQRMIAEVNANSMIISLVESNGMKFYFDRLAVLLDEFIELKRALSAAKSARPQMLTKQIKTEITEKLRILFERIEACNIVYTELNYEPLINELNNLFVARRGTVKASTTRKSNRLKTQSSENNKSISA